MVVLSVICVGAVLAQDYAIDWHTMDGGGEMWSIGGAYELSATIGQPDASMVVMTGGTYALSGGLWPGATTGVSVPGDCDGDGDVDLDDYADLTVCMAGPGGGLPEPGCACFDLGDSGEVDLLDFADFQVLFTGSSP
jgi:hypothetical protein